MKMERAMIISGRNKYKRGEIIGVFFEAGICVIKAEDGNEYVANLDEVEKISQIKKHTVIGLPKEMVEEISKKLNIDVDVDMGVVGFEDNLPYREFTYEECRETFLNKVKEKCDIEFPYDYDDITLFASDGDQDFDFYIGIMF